MPNNSQSSSNIGALVLAVIALTCIFLPAEYFIGLLIVCPLVGLSVAAWLGYTLRNKEEDSD